MLNINNRKDTQDFFIDAAFRAGALSVTLSGRQSEVFNSGLGSQFTIEAFTKTSRKNRVTFSIDGMGVA